MIDKVYQTVNTVINKEQQGYVAPNEFDLISNNVQMEIFSEYFGDENRDKNRENRGLTNKGYSNLDYNQRQKIDQFAATGVLTDIGNQTFTLPEDLYFIEDDGITTVDGTVIEEAERMQINYLKNSSAKPTDLYPIYERFSDRIKVYPTTITGALPIMYLRKPKMPKWTFFVLPDGSPAYNPASPDFQDFELHESEFSNIVVRILTYFGINLREQEVVQIAERLKAETNQKDNS